MAHQYRERSLSSSRDHQCRTLLEAALAWLRFPAGPGLRSAAGTSCWCWPCWNTQTPLPAGRPCCWCWRIHPGPHQSALFPLSHTDWLETPGEPRVERRAPWRCLRSLSDGGDVLWPRSSWQTGSAPGCLSRSCWLSLRRQRFAGWTAAPGWSARSPENNNNNNSSKDSDQGCGNDAEGSKNRGCHRNLTSPTEREMFHITLFIRIHQSISNLFNLLCPTHK